jgi:IS30 family transposase
MGTKRQTKKVTETEKRQMKLMRAKGLNPQQIGKAIKRAPGTVWSSLSRMGIDPNPNENTPVMPAKETQLIDIIKEILHSDLNDATARRLAINELRI